MLVEEELTKSIIGALIEVHKYWGPGLSEAIYERSVARELELRGLEFENQLLLPVLYKGVTVGEDLRLDFGVRRKVVLEVKAVKDLLPVHEAQIMTYMRLTNSRVGLLANFNVAVLKDGLKRIVR